MYLISLIKMTLLSLALACGTDTILKIKKQNNRYETISTYIKL